jgi:hypothetical protein
MVTFVLVPIILTPIIIYQFHNDRLITNWLIVKLCFLRLWCALSTIMTPILNDAGYIQITDSSEFQIEKIVLYHHLLQNHTYKCLKINLEQNQTIYI